MLLHKRLSTGRESDGEMDQHSQMPHINIIHVKSNRCEDRGSPRTNWQM